MRQRGSALAVLALAPALALLTPHGGLLSTSDATAPLLALVGITAWVLTGWLALVVLLTWGAGLPGALGRAATGLVSHLAPASLRALVRVAVGTTVAVSVLSGASAFAADPTPAPAIAGSATDALDWPGLAPTTQRPSPQPAATHRPSPVTTQQLTPVTTPARATAPATRQDVVVVERGDSLWSIAAHALGPSATNTRIAQAWPQWWSANRAVIGDDPDLLRPGQHLQPPTSSNGSPS